MVVCGEWSDWLLHFAAAIWLTSLCRRCLLPPTLVGCLYRLAVLGFSYLAILLAYVVVISVVDSGPLGLTPRRAMSLKGTQLLCCACILVHV
jgi:hypothetical protein